MKGLEWSFLKPAYADKGAGVDKGHEELLMKSDTMLPSTRFILVLQNCCRIFSNEMLNNDKIFGLREHPSKPALENEGKYVL